MFFKEGKPAYEILFSVLCAFLLIVEFSNDVKISILDKMEGKGGGAKEKFSDNSRASVRGAL